METEDIKRDIKKINTSIARHNQLICFCASAVIIVLTLVFLYVNFLLTVNTVKIVSALKKQVAIEVVDIDMWEKINKNIEWKKQKIQRGALDNNPFEQSIQTLK
ncbi:hypothetical protein COV56_01570 [Candidatus Kuenenbacteria bacterium CG11_big_fil_rev_8_21_14_0_20_37_9]|uniref:Uncharacterized protein n=1 Tax=Candidatus Kuenenbacteria bacterium CG1_02_38_13 TaxID=1805235 RepID=A0A1J4TYA9_9BACT|nr:MAG: hypothetical protein AUJ29_02530 [Candidatus Kuenenbacteria bacterium CG1_02_38_13]PIR05650.1 MAG: hypothetical protein COV56_01570 [Candidatus Kuenenbacteria bacterium CG11_big_fil_rev_8_21_14_0_20_37_9]